MFVCSQDDDPYVRKTAAVCVAKLHDINSQLVEDQGFLELLKDLLSDSVPMVTTHTHTHTHTRTHIDMLHALMHTYWCVPPPPPQVVANAIASLAEIGETSPSAAVLGDLDTATINKLLTALNECTEWGQVFILDSLSLYRPKEEREAQR